MTWFAKKTGLIEDRDSYDAPDRFDGYDEYGDDSPYEDRWARMHGLKR